MRADSTGSPAGHASRWRPRLPLVGACTAYVAFRLLVLHANFDAVAIPSYEISLSGNLARLASEGRFGVPIHWFYDHCGGQVVDGLLAAPLYALLGDSYLALKLVPLVLGIGTLLLAWRILERLDSRRAATLCVFLFVLAPPTLAKFSLLAQGNHFENLFFQLAAWALLLRAHERGSTPASIFAAGVAAGFALFVYFGSATTILALSLAHLSVRGFRNSFRDLRAAVPGFLLGLAPLFWIWARTGDVLSQFLSENFASGSQEPSGLVTLARRWSERVAEFLGSILPRAGGFESLGPLPARAAEIAFLACFAIAWMALLPAFLREVCGGFLRDLRGGSRPEPAPARAALQAPLLLHLPLVMLFFGASRFRFETYSPPVEIGRFRYLVPHFALALMLIAIAAARLTRAPGFRAWLGRGLATTAILTGLCTLPILGGPYAQGGLWRAYDGSNLRRLDGVVLRDWTTAADGTRYVWDHALVARRLSGLDGWERHQAYVGVGRTTAWVEVTPQTRERAAPLRAPPLERLANRYSPEYGIDIARGVGCLLRGLSAAGRSPEELRSVIDDTLASGSPLASYVAEGLCLEYTYPLALQTEGDLDRSLALAELVPGRAQAAWARGYGIQCGRLLRRGIASDVAAVDARISRIGPETADAFWLGVGWGLADARDEIEDRPVPDAFVPSERRARVLEGFGRALRHDGRASAAVRVRVGLFAPGELAAFARGIDWPGYPAPE